MCELGVELALVTVMTTVPQETPPQFPMGTKPSWDKWWCLVVVFSLIVRILGECTTIHSPRALLCFKLRLACTH